MQISDVIRQMGGLQSVARELGVSESQAASGAAALLPAILGGFKKQAQSPASGGLGGLGAVLGRKLAALAEHHQVICVTHLPQMASYASHQWVIRKQTSKGRTRTTIEELVAGGRIDELAAMLRGDSAAESTRQEALAMLAEAQAAAG